MSQPAKIAYSKPWLSHADQVVRLEQRGLVVADRAAAEQFLSHLNYYRFSGYCLAFENQRHQFVAGTTFEQVLAAYEFDLTLRDLLTEALEVVEVDVCATVAYHFGHHYGPFGHVDPTNFFSRFDHFDWLRRLRKEAERSSELFVAHCRRTYSQFPDLPVWMVTEVMSFGSLSKMIDGMLKADQKAVARRYGLQAHILKKGIHHLSYIRNLCAHHSRMWDRIWAIKPELPAGKPWQPPLLPGNNRLFSTLLFLRHLMKHIAAMNPVGVQWRTRVVDHLKTAPAVANSLDLLGLPATWESHPIWS